LEAVLQPMAASPIRIVNQRTKVVPVENVQPHPKNVNHSELGAISESIVKNGFYGSLIVQESTGYILAGTHRWQAVQQAGGKEVPVTFVDVSDEEALRIMLADNRTTRLGQDDPEALANLLQEILDGAGSLAGTGFTDDDLASIFEGLDPDETLPSEPAAGRSGRDQSGELKEQFQVLVTCDSEQKQAQLLEELGAKGWNCRALIS
jgi:ParB-like chromosome segregation protein Spo0J